MISSGTIYDMDGSWYRCSGAMLVAEIQWSLRISCREIPKDRMVVDVHVRLDGDSSAPG